MRSERRELGLGGKVSRFFFTNFEKKLSTTDLSEATRIFTGANRDLYEKRP
jgi:hypothetical protein